MVDHLMIQCVFARQVWFKCFSKVGITPSLIPMQHDRLHKWWMSTRKQISRVDKKGFDAFVMLICWTLWKRRIARVFQSGVICDEYATVNLIFQELHLWMLAGMAGVQRFCEHNCL